MTAADASALEEILSQEFLSEVFSVNTFTMTIQVCIAGTSVPCCESSFGSASARPNAMMLSPPAQIDNFHSKLNLCARASNRAWDTQ